MATIEPLSDVLGIFRLPHDDARRLAQQSLCDSHDAQASRLVRIGDQNHFASAEDLCVLRQPWTLSAAGVGGCDKPEIAKGLDVPLTFDYEHDGSFDNFAEPIQDLAGAFLPDPAATTVRTPLSKVFRLVADHL